MVLIIVCVKNTIFTFIIQFSAVMTDRREPPKEANENNAEHLTR